MGSSRTSWTLVSRMDSPSSACSCYGPLLIRHSADLDGSSYVGTRVYGGKVEVSLLGWRPAAPCLGPHPRAVTVAQDAQSY